jgi:hypothetical protein
MNPEWQAAIDGFREAAARFINVVDSCDELANYEFLTSIQRCFLKLYSSVLLLPVVEPKADDDFRVAPYSGDAKSELYGKLKAKLEAGGIYWEIFDSTKFSEPINGSLADDISDIYFDLKESVYLAERNAHPEDTVWEMRFSFSSHWGRHLTSALKAIYDLHAE